jgi:hypothetical protein
MLFFIKDQNDKLYAKCKFDKESKTLILLKSSLIKKTFNCTGCDAINHLRKQLLDQGNLENHNDELYLLNNPVEFKDINSAVCLVLGGKLQDAEDMIKNEFGKSIKEVYAEVFE